MTQPRMTREETMGMVEINAETAIDQIVAYAGAAEAYNAYLDNVIDTANGYGYGLSTRAGGDVIGACYAAYDAHWTEHFGSIPTGA